MKSMVSETCDEQAFLRKLADLGVVKGEVSELFNGPNDYDVALPLILKHVTLLRGSNQKETDALRYYLIRALAAPAAKKMKEIWTALMPLFERAEDDHERWTIGNTMQVVADARHTDDIARVLSSPKYRGAREAFCRAARRTNSKTLVPILLDNLKERRIPGEELDLPYGDVQMTPAAPITALGWLAGPDAIPAIEPFLKDCYPGSKIPDDHVRTEAKRAIDRIKKKAK